MAVAIKLRHKAFNNGLDGFQLYDHSNGNTLVSNWSIHNSGDSYHVNDSDNNTLKRNRAFGNADYGILVDAVMDNLFEDNFCRFNGLGGSNQPDVC